MTRPTLGGTKHNWLVDDLAAIVSDLRNTADAILRNLTRYQGDGNQAHLTAAALRTAELFQEINRINAVLAEMRELIEGAKAARQHPDIEAIRQELNHLHTLIGEALSEEGEGD